MHEENSKTIDGKMLMSTTPHRNNLSKSLSKHLIKMYETGTSITTGSATVQKIIDSVDPVSTVSLIT